MTLSVLSTLARLGMDPWQEAGRLAKLPRTAAIEGLARIITAMPASRWSLPDATSIAARLVALLPTRGSGPSIAASAQRADAASIAGRLMALLPARGGPAARPASSGSRAAGRWWIVFVLAGVLAGLTLVNLTGQRAAAPDSGDVTGLSASHPASPAIRPVGHVPDGT